MDWKKIISERIGSTYYFVEYHIVSRLQLKVKSLMKVDKMLFAYRLLFYMCFVFFILNVFFLIFSYKICVF